MGWTIEPEAPKRRAREIRCTTHDQKFKNWKSAYMHAVYNEGCHFPEFEEN
jgi:hypothetical protein